MTSPRPAWPAGTDRRVLFRRLAAAREEFLSTGRLPAPLRPVVAESWQRCLTSGLDLPVAAPPVDLVDSELDAYRAEHPLAAVMPIVRQLLVEDAGESGLIVAVSDAGGRLLWVEGASALRSRAERMHFVEGAVWSETAVGTNAPGTALAVNHPVQIVAAEHLSGPVTPWSCAAAPIHDPQTGELLGALDLTGGDDVAAPHAFTLIRTAAAAIETELRLRRLEQRQRAGSAAGRRRGSAAASGDPDRESLDGELAPGPGRPVLRVLGRDRAELASHTGTLTLSPRHSELLLLLTAHPAGLSADRLGVLLHERDAASVTLRVELSRLRSLVGRLGEPVLASRPYRITTPLSTDAALVRRLLDRGAHRRALSAYSGPVLPQSQAPAVTELRNRLADDLRACVLASPDPDLAWTFAQLPEGMDDVEVWQACLRRLPPGSRRRPIALARVDHLHREYGIA